VLRLYRHLIRLRVADLFRVSGRDAPSNTRNGTIHDRVSKSDTAVISFLNMAGNAGSAILTSEHSPYIVQVLVINPNLYHVPKNSDSDSFRRTSIRGATIGINSRELTPF
jgi:hypothetical protein